MSKPGKGRLAGKKGALFAKEAVADVTKDVTRTSTTSSASCDDALVLAVGALDQRAQEFVILAQRWAEDSGLASTTGAVAEGKLPSLAWQLLAIYFLQVSERVTARLPGLDVISRGNPQGCQREGLGMSAAELFRHFIDFYASDFDWQDEAACVKAAQRGRPRAGLGQNALAGEEGFEAMLCPAIEDPAQPGTNLGNMLDADSFRRIQGELAHTEMMQRCMGTP